MIIHPQDSSVYAGQKRFMAIKAGTDGAARQNTANKMTLCDLAKAITVDIDDLNVRGEERAPFCARPSLRQG